METNESQNNSTNQTQSHAKEYPPNLLLFYLIIEIILCISCIVAVVVNLKVFACISWIRRPLSSVLKMSLSLALADSCASSTYAVLIFFDDVITERVWIILEMIRLCFILVAVSHLLGLGFHHYNGIRDPLHNLKSHTSVAGMLAVLWCIPTVFILTLYSIEGGSGFWKALYNNQIKDTIAFSKTFRFRMVFSSFILLSLLLIVFYYICILFAIERQRQTWKHLSRAGSAVWRGGHTVRSRVRECPNEQKINRNFRAINTTMIIVGSCFMGWMPALLLYILTCDQGCLISGEILLRFSDSHPYETVILRFFDNEMLILKMIANPIIYSIRMEEIQEGTKRMHAAVLKFFCKEKAERDPSIKTLMTTASHNEGAQNRTSTFGRDQRQKKCHVQINCGSSHI